MTPRGPTGVKQQQAEIRRLKALRGGGEDGNEPPASRRLTLSEIVQLLLQRGARGPSGGVTLTRNAKGETQIEVSVPVGEECPTISEASSKAREVYDDLRGLYPTLELAPVPEPPKSASRGRKA